MVKVSFNSKRSGFQLISRKNHFCEFSPGKGVQKLPPYCLTCIVNMEEA